MCKIRPLATYSYKIKVNRAKKDHLPPIFVAYGKCAKLDNLTSVVVTYGKCAKLDHLTSVVVT